MVKSSLSQTLLKTALVAVFFAFGVSSVNAAELFSDSFETDFSEWDGVGAEWRIITSSGAHTGTKRAHAEGSSAGGVLTKSLSTEGFEDVSVSFWYKVSGLEANDEIEVDFSADGGATWENDIVFFRDAGLENINEWTMFSSELGDLAENNPDFILRFRLATDTASDDFDLDDVRIIATEIEINTDEDNDGVLDDEDMCLDTSEDEAGLIKFNPNHWRYDGTMLVKALTKGKGGNSSAYTMVDTKGCGCDQILDVLATEMGEDYGGQRKFGCTAGMIEEFMSVVW